MYGYVPHQQTFILMSRRSEQDKAIDAACVCMSGEFSVRIHQCGQLCIYVYCIYVSVCVPTGTTHSAVLLDGPGSCNGFASV